MDKITDFEKIIDLKLPDDYKEFLIKDVNDKYKRGMFVYKNMEGQSRRITGIIKKFLTLEKLEKNEQHNLFSILSKHQHELPRGVIPIATDTTINYVVMSLNKKDYGYVYRWNYMDEPEVVKRPSYKNMYMVAKSFSEFIDSLQIYEKTSLYIKNKIRLFEHNLDGQFPMDFKEFMVNNDINLIIGKNIDFIDNYHCEETARISYVYGFKENQRDIVKNYEFHLDENTIEGIVPIIDDEGGNLICISARRKDSGKIYFIDHEIGAEDMEELPIVAENFTEFINKLY